MLWRGMEHVVLVEVVDILSRDDVDLRVPVMIQVIKGRKLSLLLLSNIRKIFCYQFDHFCLIVVTM